MFQKFLIMNKNNTKVLLELEFDTEYQVLCYTVFGGEETKILFQRPKSFQAWHFRLKSFYKIFFFAECRAQISVNFSCVLNISTLQIPSKFGAHCPSNKLRKEKVGYITI